MSFEQVAFCETVVSDLRRLFPNYPAEWFTSNAQTAILGTVMVVTIPASVARELLDKVKETK